MNAAYNIGRVFAHRCHQAGIDSMIFEQDDGGDKVRELALRYLTNHGVYK